MLPAAWSILSVLLSVTGVCKEASANKQEPPVVKVMFVMDQRPDDPSSDTLFYPARRLKWSDFRGTPSRGGPSAAVAFTSFSYEGSSLLRKDTLQITLRLQVFFIRSASWVRGGSMDSYSLAHEQLHFDITYLVARRFMNKVRELPLTKEDFDSMIQYEYLESFREMNRLQEGFDGETRHGTVISAQLDWNRKIARQLEDIGTGP
jgi:hypothetical protein